MYFFYNVPNLEFNQRRKQHSTKITKIQLKHGRYKFKDRAVTQKAINIRTKA